MRASERLCEELRELLKRLQTLICQSSPDFFPPLNGCKHRWKTQNVKLQIYDKLQLQVTWFSLLKTVKVVFAFLRRMHQFAAPLIANWWLTLWFTFGPI